MRLHLAEPRPEEVARLPVVVDASCIAALAFADPASGQVIQALAGTQPVAPDLLRYEITNVGMSKFKRRECDLEAALAGLERFEAMAIELALVPLTPVLRLAARSALTAYDASYLWLAGELRAPLLTFDRRLAEAARDYFDAGLGE